MTLIPNKLNSETADSECAKHLYTNRLGSLQESTVDIVVHQKQNLRMAVLFSTSHNLYLTVRKSDLGQIYHSPFLSYKNYAFMKINSKINANMDLHRFPFMLKKKIQKRMLKKLSFKCQ